MAAKELSWNYLEADVNKDPDEYFDLAF